MIKNFLYMLVIFMSGQGLYGGRSPDVLNYIMSLDRVKFCLEDSNNAEWRATSFFSRGIKRDDWSPLRAAWCGAALRGCQERARVVAHKSAISTPDIGKPSDRESELK